MRTQSFEVVLDRHPSDDDVDTMYEAGLDDCTIERGVRGPPAMPGALLDGSIAATITTKPRHLSNRG